MGAPHIAGLLQYSEPLRDQIEEYLLKVYAAAFIPALESAVEDSGDRLAAINDQVDALERSTDRLEREMSATAFNDLVRQLAPLAHAGALNQFRIRPERILHHLRTGNVRHIRKYLDRIRRMASQMRQEAAKALADQAEGMRADIAKWREHYDAEFEPVEGRPPEPLEIELEDAHFPFLGDKFRRHVKKLRGQDAEMFDDIPKIKVVLARLPPGAIGAWSNQADALIVSPPELKPYERVRDQLDHVLTHELRHTTQGVMAKALGVSHYLFDEQGNPRAVLKPGPGMAPRRMLNPKFTQRLLQLRDNPEAEELIRQAQARGLQPDDVYRLDDMEFYAHLGDTVRDFRNAARDSSWTPEQRKLASDIFLGNVQLPETREEFGPWIEKHDPTLAVVRVVQRQHPFLTQMQAHSPAKFKKAVKEFSKATERERGAVPEPEGLEKLWEMFLEERYDGGKDKVRNPNPDTRDSHPEITVNYLMRQDAPTYQPGRRRVRQEFASWRARRQRPAAPSPGGAGLGIFDAPSPRRA